jgi:hypothetical protein
MTPSTMLRATAVVEVSLPTGRMHDVARPPVVRGWLYDSIDHWWALLVGAPPRSLV